jgi:hypothetical protein
MTPNILKTNVGGDAGHSLDRKKLGKKLQEQYQQGTETTLPRTWDQGANSATKGATDTAEGLRARAKQTVRQKKILLA